MTEPNYYDLIGVNRNARASEIRQAYYQRAKQLHPDKKGGDPELMKTLTAAYQTLSDAERKAEYDENLEEEIAAGSNPEISATLSEPYSTKYRIRHGLYRTRFATGSHAEDSDSSSDEDPEGLGRSGEGNATSGRKFRHLSDSWQCYYEYGNAQHESIFHLTTAIRRRLPASSSSDKVPPLELPTVRQAVSEFTRLLKFDGTTVAASWYCKLRQLKEALERKLPADPNADAGEQVLYVATVCRLLNAVGNISITAAIVFDHATLGDVTALLDCVKYRKLFNFVMSLDIRLPGLREAKRLDGRQVAKDLLERIKNAQLFGTCDEWRG
ncbi:chaperone protein dnaJ 10-like protein [Aphelenchoides avenae]|nr:chaperone protein dnaJ 10-like protein [Aphelenchus avenae]